MSDGVLEMRCLRCPKTWDPPEPIDDRAAMIRICTDVAAHARDDHGDEDAALVMERHALHLGARP